MKPVDDGLFAHIKESLTEHEEAYTPGAWERFNKKERKRIGWPWFAGLGSAAAALLIGFAIFFTTQNTPDPISQQQIKANLDKPDTGVVSDVVPKVNPSRDMVKKLNTEVAENKNIVQQRRNNNIVNSPLIVAGKSDRLTTAAATRVVNAPVQLEATIPDNNLVAGSINVKAIVSDSSATAKKAVNAQVSATDNPVRSFQDFLDAEVKANGALAAANVNPKKADKWEMGLVIAPSIGNGKKINMGYGVSMGYALSDKVSISSGISYNELAASKNIDRGSNGMLDAPANMALVSDTKSLESVDANLVGIDIPLGIKYYLTKKFYTNLGVSAFAVLNQKQNNNYLQGAVEHTVLDPRNVNGFNAVFKTRTVSEVVPSGELRDNKYLGFYNISFGYQQKISEGKAFSVEPFLKLPMKEFTKENLYLIGTGVRLKFDF